jgi:hypothetical protein
MSTAINVYISQLAEILRPAERILAFQGRLCSLNELGRTLTWQLCADREFRMLIGMSIILTQNRVVRDITKN